LNINQPFNRSRTGASEGSSGRGEESAPRRQQRKPKKNREGRIAGWLFEAITLMSWSFDYANPEQE